MVGATLHQPFSKQQAQVVLDAIRTINDCFHMLDKYNIISTSVSEVVENIPTNEKDYHKCSFTCFALRSHSIQKADQHIPNIEVDV